MVTIKENAYFNPPHFLPPFLCSFPLSYIEELSAFLLSFVTEFSMSYIIFEIFEQNLDSNVALSNCSIH